MTSVKYGLCIASRKRHSILECHAKSAQETQNSLASILVRIYVQQHSLLAITRWFHYNILLY